MDNFKYNYIPEEKEYNKDVTEKTSLGYTIKLDAASTLQGKQIPVTMTKLPNETQEKLTNGFTADVSSFHGDYSQADAKVDHYESLDRVQNSTLKDKKSIAQIASISASMNKFGTGDSDTRAAYYENHTDITASEMLHKGLAMCSEKMAYQCGYMNGHGFDCKIMGGEMNGEKHSWFVTSDNTGQRIVVDPNNVGFDEEGNTIPGIYILNGDTGTHFLDGSTLTFSV